MDITHALLCHDLLRNDGGKSQNVKHDEFLLYICLGQWGEGDLICHDNCQVGVEIISPFY